MKTSAVSVTIYDMSGAPLNPYIVRELEKTAERLVKHEKQLAINVAHAGT